MNTLNTVKEQLALLGVLEPSTSHERKLFFVSNVICFCLSIIYFTTVVWFILFEAQTFAEYTECSFFALSALISLAWYSLMFWKRKQYSDLFVLVDVTVRQRCKKSVAIEGIYRKADQTVENVTKQLTFFCVRILTSCNLMVPLVVSFYKFYSSGNFKESFLLWYKASYPFDVHTPIGFTIGYIIQLLTSYLAVIMFTIQMFVAGGFIWFVSAFTLDIKACLDQLSVEVKAIKNEKPTIQQRIRIKEIISDIIQFHSEAKHLTENISDLINGNIVMYKVYSMTSFCGLLLQENIFLENGNYSELVNMFAPTVAPMVWLYLFCHTGSFLSECFASVGDKLYGVFWYMLPLDDQKIWPFLIVIGHKNVILRGFGSSSCTRELFKKIMNTTFSYFMVLRSFDYQ